MNMFDPVASAKSKITNLVGQVEGIVIDFNNSISTIETGVEQNKKKIETLVAENVTHSETIEYAKRVRDKFAEIIK
jgi:hypothetical protein